MRDNARLVRHGGYNIIQTHTHIHYTCSPFYVNHLEWNSCLCSYRRPAVGVYFANWKMCVRHSIHWPDGLSMGAETDFEPSFDYPLRTILVAFHVS